MDFGAVHVRHSWGGSRHGCPMPSLPVGCQGSRGEWCCSPPGKHRASWELPAALQGANYGSEAPGCSPTASARAAAGLLRSQPAAASPAATWPRPAQLSSAGQMGPGLQELLSPSSIPWRASQKLWAAKGRGRSPTSISFYCIIFLHSQNPSPSLGGYCVPQHDFPGLCPPEQCISHLASKTFVRLVPF